MTHGRIKLPEEIYNRQEDGPLIDFIRRVMDTREKVAPVEDFAGTFKEDAAEREEMESLVHEQRVRNKTNSSIKFAH